MSYHITGLISSAIFLLTIGGLWSQLGFVWRRKQSAAEGETLERPTAVLSVNQFVSSFLAFFSFFLYGMCLEPFNHYLVWPRLAASVLTLAVLFEIVRDRRERVASFTFALCVLLLVGAPLGLLTISGATEWGTHRVANADRHRHGDLGSGVSASSVDDSPDWTDGWRVGSAASVLLLEGHLHDRLRTLNGHDHRLAADAAFDRERGDEADHTLAFPLGEAQSHRQPAARHLGGRTERDAR